MSKKIVVTKNEADEFAIEVMERAIVDISESLRRIEKTRVTRKMIVALIKDNIGYSKAVIEAVLASLENLEKNYLKGKK